ncbi:hypothetical protein ACIQGZ_25915 [Streptomyces sp. NPDC092296]|uniref:hypothetical protein n=1 Tax=Streptomyces sp. NPDC092296 TaxID=3366012 RepID=UPI0037F191DC
MHLPRLTTARSQALTELELPKWDREALPRLQLTALTALTALTDFVAELDELIEGIRPISAVP